MLLRFQASVLTCRIPHSNLQVESVLQVMHYHKIITFLSQSFHFRGNHRCSIKKGVLKNFAKFTGKTTVPESLLNKVAGLRHRCFPVNFAKFLRTPFLQNTSASTISRLSGEIFVRNISSFEFSSYLNSSRDSVRWCEKNILSLFYLQYWRVISL